MKKNLRPVGFTLVELLITIAIIGILAGGILIGINPLEQISKAKDANKRIAVSQLVTALELYAAQNGDKYPQEVGGSSGWITTLVNNGELKDVPSAIPAGTFPCSIEQNGYCYKTNANQTEAIVYAPLETSAHPSGTTPYFLWSSAGGESGIYYSVSSDITNTSGFIFGSGSSLTQGLVGWWKMNGNANDSSGNSNNGTVNGATLTTNRSGQASMAYSFDGVNDNIILPSSIYGASVAGTASLWLYPRAYSTSDGLSKFFFYEGGSYDFMLQFNNSSGRIGFDVWTLGITSGTTTIPLNAWGHVVATWGSNGVRGYINGALVGSSATTTQAIIHASSGYIGQKRTGYFTNASIDDVRAYTRTLSSDEITNLYNAGPQ